MPISGSLGVEVQDRFLEQLKQRLFQEQLAAQQQERAWRQQFETGREARLAKSEEEDAALRKRQMDRLIAAEQAEADEKARLRRIGEQVSGLGAFPEDVQRTEAVGLMGRADPLAALKKLTEPAPEKKYTSPLTVAGPKGEKTVQVFEVGDPRLQAGVAGYNEPPSPSAQRPRVDIRSVQSRGPNGEPGTKVLTFMDGVLTEEHWEPGNPSATERKDLGDFQTLSDAFDAVDTAYKPELVGPAAGRWGSVTQVVPGLKVPEGFTDLNSKLAQVQNSLIYLKSGKQINEAEFARLQRELPLITDKPDVFIQKLDNAKTLMEKIAANRRASVGVPTRGGGGAAPSADSEYQEYLRRRGGGR